MAATLDPFRAWRRIVESAAPRKPPRRPVAGPKARALAAAAVEELRGDADAVALAGTRPVLDACAALLADDAPAAPRRAVGLLALLARARELSRVGTPLDTFEVDLAAVAEAQRAAAACLREAARLVSLAHVLRVRVLPTTHVPPRPRPDPTCPEGVAALADDAALAPTLAAVADALATLEPSRLVPAPVRDYAAWHLAPEHFRDRGRAAVDRMGRSRAALVRELAARLPDTAERYALVAALATAAGVEVGRATVRAILTR